MGSHTQLRDHSNHTAAVIFPPLLQPKLIFDLVTPEGSKAELTWVVVTSQESLRTKKLNYLNNILAVSHQGTESTIMSRKSGVLPTRPLSNTITVRVCLLDFNCVKKFLNHLSVVQTNKYQDQHSKHYTLKH